MTYYGYGRVSTAAQNLDRQELFFEKLGIPKENVYLEKISSGKKERPMLNALKSKLKSGDVLYIESLSRLARSTTELLSLLEHFQDLGVTVISERENIDMSTAMGKFALTVMCAIAEMEKSVLKERVKEGLLAAKNKGHRGGRPPTPEKVKQQALQLYDGLPDNGLNVTSLCKAVGISRPTLYKILREREYKKAN